jgi:hypothetical protein
MDPIQNPFSPGAGTRPPELVGRDHILNKAYILFERIKAGRSEKGFFLVGLRGVGKTVLLNEIDLMCREAEYCSIYIEAHEKKSLPALILPRLRELLYQLDRIENASHKIKKAFRVLAGFIRIMKLKFQDIELSLDIDPETGTADSGDIESDLPALLEVIAEAAAERKKVIAIIIDELQYLSEHEMSALIMAVHRIVQKKLPLTIIGAGSPQLVGLMGRSKSYAERLFDFPLIGPLEKTDAISAVKGPVNSLNVDITNDAVDEIYKQTQGYPYFVQEWAYQAWNVAEKSPIQLHDIHHSTTISLKRLDENFFRVRFDRLTPREKEYLYALAELGKGDQRSGDIAEKLNVSPQSIAPIRNSLIKKGMIYSPSHGVTTFTVPLFESFMMRAMSSVTQL